MSNRNLVHEACGRSSRRRRGIPLNHNPVIGRGLEQSFDLTSHQPELAGETRLVCYVRAVVGDRDLEEF